MKKFLTNLILLLMRINNNNLNIIFIIAITFSIHNFTFAVEPNEILKNSSHENRARSISKNIRCLVCQNQSIDESNASLAKDLRILIREKITNGRTDKEIYNFLNEKYGDFIMLKPALKLNTFLLWMLPLFFLVISLMIIYKHNKKSKKNYNRFN